MKTLELVQDSKQTQRRIKRIWSMCNVQTLGFADDPALFSLTQMQFNAKLSQYRLNYPNHLVYFIYVAEALCGYLLLNKQGNRLTIIDIAIAPSYQGLGIGTWVIRQCEILYPESISVLELSVLKTNRARKLYAKLGFLLMSEDGVYQHMQRRLGASTCKG